ncbi:MAG: ribbon-helix-helix protein, CopG family [Methanobrevibacter sp.]|jgi:hypothetical protein|nr:ribbon-helix-helix protein, CopG family [Candidatus Methanovirga australis]
MTDIHIEESILKSIEKIAIKENKTKDEFIEETLKKAVEEKSDKPRIFFDLSGKFSAGEPFSAVEDLKKMRNGEL